MTREEVLLKIKNTFFFQDEVIDSLVKRYKKYGTLILAVDFDETIFNCYNHPGKDFTIVHELIREAAKLNFKIVIYTARNEVHFPYIDKYCRDNNIPTTHAINKDVVELIEPTSGKIYYNIFLDDKAGLGQAVEILYNVIERIKNGE